METWYNKYAALVMVALVAAGGYEYVAWATLTRQDWAAWVQALGTVIALAIAIGVPLSQRAHDQRVKRQEWAAGEVTRAFSLFYLLVDVKIFMDGLLTMRALPRNELLGEARLAVIHERISAQEARETSVKRVDALFRARRALFDTALTVGLQVKQRDALHEREINDLKNRIADFELVLTYAREEMRRTELFERSMRPPIRALDNLDAAFQKQSAITHVAAMTMMRGTGSGKKV
jgi:hypothetical protein